MTLISVDLPAPLSPIRPDDLVPADGEVDVAQRLDGAERHLDALEPDDVGVAAAIGHALPCFQLRRHHAPASSRPQAARHRPSRRTLSSWAGGMDWEGGEAAGEGGGGGGRRHWTDKVRRQLPMACGRQRRGV